jgi:hypothetical protein
MFVQNESYKYIEPSYKTTEMLGLEIVQVAKSGKRLDIIFHKGIALSLTQKVMTLHRDKIFNKKQGNLIATIDDFGVFIHFFTLNLDNILIIIYVEKKNNVINSCTKMYVLYKKICGLINTNSPISKILNICNQTIKIQ